MKSETEPLGKAPRVSRRVRRIPVSATKAMPVLADKIGGCVSLGQGVPSFPTPPYVVEAVCNALRDNAASGKYSLQPGLLALREAIARSLQAEKGIYADPHTEIGVTVGAMEALLAAILTLIEPGDEVVLPSPTYASYIEQVMLADGVPVFAPLRSSDWGLDLEAVAAAITSRTRAVMLCNPSNPTGAVCPEAEVRALAELVRTRDLVLIYDETYDFLCYDGPSPLSPAALPGLAERVISVFSFSKKYAMTGWRVGYFTAPRSIMPEIMKVHDVAAICAPTPSQCAALAALGGPPGHAAEMKAALARRRDLCCRRLDALGGAFDYVRPQGAFYVMARYRFTDALSRDVALQLLEEARVITVPGGSFGPGGEGHLRLSFGGTEAEIETAFDRIEQWLQRRT
jgi:aminotransferase